MQFVRLHLNVCPAHTVAWLQLNPHRQPQCETEFRRPYFDQQGTRYHAYCAPRNTPSQTSKLLSTVVGLDRRCGPRQSTRQSSTHKRVCGLDMTTQVVSSLQQPGGWNDSSLLAVNAYEKSQCTMPAVRPVHGADPISGRQIDLHTPQAGDKSVSRNAESHGNLREYCA